MILARLVPDSVLLKPGKLDADEWTIAQKHVEYGVEILEDRVTCRWRGDSGAQYHHENGMAVVIQTRSRVKRSSLVWRIAAVADVFDA